MLLSNSFNSELDCRFCGLKKVHTVTPVLYDAVRHTVRCTVVCSNCYNTAYTNNEPTYPYIKTEVPVFAWNEIVKPFKEDFDN